MIRILVFILSLGSVAAFAVKGKVVGSSGELWKHTVKYELKLRGGDYSECHGTLFGWNLIVTAAHCLEGVDPNTKLYISFFKGSTLTDSLVLNSSDFKMHSYSKYPGPNAGNYRVGSDVAVLRIKKPIPLGYESMDSVHGGIQHLFQVSKKVWTAGSSNPSLDGKLRFATGTISSFVYSTAVKVRLNRGQKTCMGDSGGPLVVFHNGRPYLLGVLSGQEGDPCHGTTYFTFLSDDVETWIYSIP